MSETHLTSPYGDYDLLRLPRRPRELLRAWDAADELLLQTLKDRSITLNRPLICNDSFGALSVALHSFHPISWSDSVIAHQATRLNLQENALAETDVDYLSSIDLPKRAVSLAIIKLPKTLALFEYQLIRLRPLLTAHSTLLVAGMAKAMPPAVWKILERIIGPTQTSRAFKKSKVIQVSVNVALGVPSNPYPVVWKLEETEFSLSNHANVFSRDKLDIGTRFLLQNLPQTEGEGDIIDLGCGNGVLGLMAAQQNPQVRLHFVDESYMALESARENCKQLPGYAERMSFHAALDLADFEDQSCDLILCNPPFHQKQAVGDTLAISMFRESARVLRSGCELWVIGNQHLGYHQKLKNWFDQVELVASNSKFVIFKATTSG